jgi:hypothetical protein
MAGTLTLTVQDPAGTAAPDVEVRAYNGTVFAAAGRTNASGVIAFAALPDASYKVHLNPNDHTYPTQWANGGYDALTAPVVATIAGGPQAVTLKLRTATSPEELDDTLARANVVFWKDTSAGNTVIALNPGEERTRVFDDRADPIYHHVLVGPFLTSAKAAAA